MSAGPGPQTGDIVQVRKGPEGSFLRRAAETMVREVMETQIARRAGAGA